MNPDSHAPRASARLHTLENAAGLRVQVLEQGAAWVSCSVPLSDGSRREVLLGGAEPAGDSHPWQVDQVCGHALTLRRSSAAGDDEVRVHYALGGDLSLQIAWETASTSDSAAGQALQVWFNLDGDAGCATPGCLKQHLQVMAPAWLPVDAEGRPMQGPRPVDGTGFDLRELRRLDEAIGSDLMLEGQGGFDHAFLLEPDCRDALRAAARLLSADGRLALSLATDLPALRFCSGQDLAGVVSRDGFAYAAHAGIALTPRDLPGAPGAAAPTSGPRQRHCVRYFFDAA